MLDIKPTEGKVALQLLDDGDDDDDTKPIAEGGLAPGEDEYNSTIYAIVLGVGPKVTGMKKGQTVIARECCRDCPRVSDDVVIAESWHVLASVAE